MAQPHPFFLLLLACFSLHFSAYAKSYLNEPLQKAYTEALKLKTGNAEALLKKELSREDKNATALLVANYIDFLTICTRQHPEETTQLIKAQQARLEKLDKWKETSEWADYSRAEIRAQLAMSELLFGSKLAAAWDFRKAYLQFKANEANYPDFIPNRKTLGVMQVLLGSVPEQYKWLLNIVGMKGDTRQGLANLKYVTQHANPFRNEAKLYHALVLQLLDEENARTTTKQMAQLAGDHPDNLLFTFVAIVVHKKAKMADDALYLYHKRPVGAAYSSFPYLHHLAADLYLYKGDFEASIKENRYFLDRNKGVHYIKAANLKLFMAYWLSNHTPQAKWYYQQVSQMGTNVTEEDSYAAAYVSRKEQPNRWLLLSRLHSDGGYYKKALQELEQLNPDSEEQTTIKAEYYYRKARIYHGMQDTARALTNYKTAITACKNEPLYFAPHAALQLGYIYQQQNKPETARTYYNQALQYKGSEYRNSIHAKAKLALSTLP